MKKKLTLSIEESVKKRARRYARKQGKSVSEMVERYLEEVTKSDQWQPPSDSPVHSFAGTLPLPDTEKSDEELLTSILEEEYDESST